GRTFWQSLQRGDFMGEICASGRGRAFRRSVRGCNRRIAPDRGSSAGAAGKEQEREWESKDGKSRGEKVVCWSAHLPRGWRCADGLWPVFSIDRRGGCQPRTFKPKPGYAIL